MSKSTALATAFLTGLLGLGTSHAQDAPPTWSPLELFGCTFNADAGLDDLDPVIESWNEWMDENGVNDYTAVLLVPNFTAADFPFDVLWLGAWRHGAGLASLQQWFAEAGEVQDDFAEVVECPLHQAFAVTNLKEPAEPQGITPVEFSNCTLQPGRTGPEARRALIEWSEFLSANGSDAGHWILRPGPGEAATADYTFKWVTVWPSYASIGRDFELFFNGGGFARFSELTGRVMSCDYPRLYNSRLLREMEE